MTVGVALCRMSSTRRKSDLVSISLPSGECVLMICLTTALSSDDEKRWAERSLFISCNLGCTATGAVVVGAGAGGVDVRPAMAGIPVDIKPAISPTRELEQMKSGGKGVAVEVQLPAGWLGLYRHGEEEDMRQGRN